MIDFAKLILLVGSFAVVGVMYFFFSIKPPAVVQGDVLKPRVQASFLSIDESILPRLTEGETYNPIESYKDSEIGKREFFENPNMANFFSF